MRFPPPWPVSPLQEQQKYAQLQVIIMKLDEEKKRGDSLLYAMIPKAVADRLRKGIGALETCQVQPRQEALGLMENLLSKAHIEPFSRQEGVGAAVCYADECSKG